MSFLSDIGSITNSDFLTGIGNTELGKKYSDKLVSSINKKIIPKPVVSATPAATAQEAPVFNLSEPDQGIAKKIAMAVGGVFALLVIVYFVKKGK